MTSRLFLLPTSRGAMYATQSCVSNPIRRLLLALMVNAESPVASMEMVVKQSAIPGTLAARMLDRVATFGLVETFLAPYRLDQSLSEDVLSERLSQVSEKKKALLADRHGFCLASSGFPAHETDALAGLCAEMAALRLRHAALSDSPALAGVGAWHCDRLGSARDCRLHPIFVGEHQFTLLISGQACLETRALADMVWMLMRRYGMSHPK